MASTADQGQPGSGPELDLAHSVPSPKAYRPPLERISVELNVEEDSHMTQAVELAIDRLWILRMTWYTGTVTSYPASNAREAAALQAALEVHPKVRSVQRHPYDEADLVPPAVREHDPGRPRCRSDADRCDDPGG